MRAPSLFAVLLAASLALFATSCGGGTGASACARGCFAWQYCDAVHGTCVPSACSTDADCVARTRCAAHVCEPTTCASDAECDDGQFCNGPEICHAPTLQSPNGCQAGTPPCTGATICDEAVNACQATCADPDHDGDHHRSIACGGDDCDDDDPDRFPTNVETCDTMGHDEDCDATTFGERDGDGDGYPDARCCNHQGGGAPDVCGSDCNDTDSRVHPGLAETCDHKDNDCNGVVDDMVSIAGYVDFDHDGAGAPGTPMNICPQELGNGFSVYASDCDDKNPAIVPGAMKCTGGQSITAIQICQSNGTWMAATCPAQRICFVEPNNTGLCL